MANWENLTNGRTNHEIITRCKRNWLGSFGSRGRQLCDESSGWICQNMFVLCLRNKNAPRISPYRGTRLKQRHVASFRSSISVSIILASFYRVTKCFQSCCFLRCYTRYKSEHNTLWCIFRQVHIVVPMAIQIWYVVALLAGELTSR